MGLDQESNPAVRAVYISYQLRKTIESVLKIKYLLMVQVFATTNIFNQSVFVDNQIAVRQKRDSYQLNSTIYPPCCKQARKDHTKK